MRKSTVDAAYEKFKAEVLDRDPVVRGFPFYDIGEFVTVAQLPDLGLKSTMLYSWPAHSIFLFGGPDPLTSERVMSVFEFARTFDKSSSFSLDNSPLYDRWKKAAAQEILKYSCSSAEELMLKLEIKS